MTKFKPCPWCGRTPMIVLTDELGAPYKPNPRPAGYSLFHISQGEDDRCPIATEAWLALGVWLYDNEEEAAEAWNARMEDT